MADWNRKDSSTGYGATLRPQRFVTSATIIFFELFAEIGENRTLEQQLRPSQKMEPSRQQAGGIAHDFNNLLMVISGYGEFLLDRIGDEPAAGADAGNCQRRERATSLTRQLLAFSRKQMLAPQILDLNAMVTRKLQDADPDDRRRHRTGHDPGRRILGRCARTPARSNR